MRNKKITVYDLISLMKDGKAPKNIKIYDEEFKLIENHYYLGETYAPSNDLYYKMARGFVTLNDTVEIISEGNDEKTNLVDLEFKDNEPIGFKFDTSINKPVLARRCDNYYYAYPSLKGWVYYRSRYLGDKDKEIINIKFDEWAYKVLETLIQEFIQKNKNDEWKDIRPMTYTDEKKYYLDNRDDVLILFETLSNNQKKLFKKINEIINNQKYLKERLDKSE